MEEFSAPLAPGAGLTAIRTRLQLLLPGIYAFVGHRFVLWSAVLRRFSPANLRPELLILVHARTEQPQYRRTRVFLNACVY
jgi:hypothetical protein